MSLSRVIDLINAEFDPLIAEKEAAFNVLRDELVVLRATRDDRIKKAAELETIVTEQSRLADVVAKYDPAVLAVFEAEAKLPSEPSPAPEPVPVPDPEPVIP